EVVPYRGGEIRAEVERLDDIGEPESPQVSLDQPQLVVRNDLPACQSSRVGGQTPFRQFSTGIDKVREYRGIQLPQVRSQDGRRRVLRRDRVGIGAFPNLLSELSDVPHRHRE